MDEPEEHIYHTINREEAAMDKKRENSYQGLQKDSSDKKEKGKKRLKQTIPPMNQ